MKYILEKKAGEDLQLPATALPNLRRKGKGPTYIKLAGTIFYTQEALDAWVLSCTHYQTVTSGAVENVNEEADHV